MEEKDNLTIGIITYNPGQELNRCLTTIYNSKCSIRFKVIIWDNSEEPGTYTNYREKYSNLNIKANKKNIGYARAINQIFRESDTEYVLILNSDIELDDNTIEILYKKIEKNKTAGLISCSYYNKDGTRQINYSNEYTGFTDIILEKLFYISSLKMKLENTKIYQKIFRNKIYDDQKIAWIGGACMMIRRAAFDSIDGFDEDFFLYWEEMEFQKRMAENNWDIFFTPDTKIIHLWSENVRDLEHITLVHIKIGERLYALKHFKKWQKNIYKIILSIEIKIRKIIFMFIGNIKKYEAYKKIEKIFNGEKVEGITDKYKTEVLEKIRI